MLVTSKNSRYEKVRSASETEGEEKRLANTSTCINSVKCTTETSDCPYCERVHLTRPAFNEGGKHFFTI